MLSVRGGREEQRHARDSRAGDGVDGRRGAVWREGPRRVGRHSRRRLRRERDQERDRDPLHRAADHAGARARGARESAVKLFEGVRVLDLSRMLAGPYGSMLLADMGAEVIKIVDPDGGDPMRVMGPPFLPDGESAYFLAINRNKKSVALDLAKEAGREGFYDLVPQADVVWENFRPRGMERLGGADSRLRSPNQRAILC